MYYLVTTYEDKIFKIFHVFSLVTMKASLGNNGAASYCCVLCIVGVHFNQRQVEYLCIGKIMSLIKSED